jgi:glycosyltransferase involved in cell wall biosynthesis
MSSHQPVFRLAILNSHPIQYFAPLYRRLAQEPDLDLTVYYCSRQGVDAYRDSGFGGETVRWDVPLLDGYESVFLHNLGRSKEVGGFWSLTNPAIISALRKERYDAIWVHGHNHLTYLFAYAAAKSAGTAIFTRGETHLLLQRSAWKRILRRPLMNVFYAQCDACLAIGTRNTDFYRNHGVSDEKIFSVPYTVDNEHFMRLADASRPCLPAIREKLGLAPDLPVVLYASKFTRRKHPLDLLQAKSNLQRQNLDCAVLMIGAGEEEPGLREYVQTQGLRDVHFLGFRNQSELPGLYALADIFVLPSENEPWGLIINEVMCAGVAVVATDEIGAVADLVREGDNGLLYSARDVNQLTARLASLLRDPEGCRRMGERSREIISGWSYEQCVQGVKEALRSLRQVVN